MFKRLAAVTITAAMLSSTPVYAGQWMQDSDGWWWQDDEGSYPVSQWKWLDGDNDGVSERYYFGPGGYILTDTTAPDGEQVNESGAWTIGGIVQREETEWVKRNTVAIPMTAEEYEQLVDRVNRMKENNSQGGGWSTNPDVDETDSGDAENEAVEYIDEDELACRVVELVNEVRAERGKDVLEINDELMENATLRAEEASNYFSHTRPNKSKYDTVISSEWYLAAENIIRLEGIDIEHSSMEGVAKKIVEDWMNSSGHRKNLLDSEWTETGVGIYINGTGIYASQLYIKY